ncbi:MAG: hypothetical protein IJT65_05095 [Eubacterium sp.]|nr:hypothetical protein [Eubacterium sp.]
MVNKLINSDYEVQGGGYATVELCEELLQNALVTLKVKRGRFYPNKDFGSLLYTLEGSEADERICALARQALYDMNGVFVKKAKLENGNILIDLIINNSEERVSIPLENNI